MCVHALLFLSQEEDVFPVSWMHDAHTGAHRVVVHTHTQQCKCREEVCNVLCVCTGACMLFLSQEEDVFPVSWMHTQAHTAL